MTPRRSNARMIQEWVTAYSFLLPNILGLMIFVFIPILYAFYVSLHDWNALSPKVYVGFQNYVTLISDEQWWHSVTRTLLFSVVYVPLLFCLALLSALLVNGLRGKSVGVVRTMFLLPFAVTSVISAIIVMFLLDPRNGLANQLLSLVGIGKQQFLGSPTQAIYCVILTLLWINIGYNMTIFLSAIKEIPIDYFEAAHIDGATRFQSFRYITFPLLRETNTFILIVTTIASFQIFDHIIVMTKGGPMNSTEVSVLYIFKEAFQMLNMGYSSALAFVLFLIVFAFSMIQLKFFSSKD
ncbi:carbohydrate ABC transporter permease [Paenibacillus sp. V4I5]|uniref:carbohydrate ABC transporter permease n=1 Tax=Paenibacillus sp. V4I5 TaxID=3042306 RepID=UPI00278E2DCD|nr:sugar ABC transporter permease [Paenibacillus sp. V4I5]MDQ0920719.1 multiple sugar transport system permease protein [Paenibacillus sp. V4I5]